MASSGVQGSIVASSRSTEILVRDATSGIEVIAVASFPNGAQLRYRRDPQGRIHEELFKPTNSQTPWLSRQLPHSRGLPNETLDDPAALLQATLDEYTYWIENHAIAEFKYEWSALAEIRGTPRR